MRKLLMCTATAFFFLQTSPATSAQEETASEPISIPKNSVSGIVCLLWPGCVLRTIKRMTETGTLKTMAASSASLMG